MAEPNPTPERSNFVRASNWNMCSKIGGGGSTVSSNNYSLDCGNPLAGLATSVLWVDPGTSWGTIHGTWQTAAFSRRCSEKALALQRQVGWSQRKHIPPRRQASRCEPVCPPQEELGHYFCLCDRNKWPACRPACLTACLGANVGGVCHCALSPWG